MNTKLYTVFFALTTFFSISHTVLFFNNLILPYPQNIAGNDFSHFYTAGTMARNNQGYFLYDHQAFQKRLSQTSSPYSYPNLTYRSLPFVSLFFVPFSFLPYHLAFYTYFFLNLIFLVLVAFFLKTFFPQFTQLKLWPLTIMFFLPVTLTLIQGQTSILTFLVVLLTVALLRLHRLFAAGAIFSLFLIKPHLLFFISLFLILFLPKKFFLGLFAGCFFLMVIGFFVSSPYQLINYPNYLLATENSAFGTFPNQYAGLNSLLKSLPLNWLLIPFFLLLFILKTRRLPALIKFSLALLFAFPLSPHTPTYELSLLLISVFHLSPLLSLLLYSSLILSLAPGLPPYLSVLMIFIALIQNPTPACRQAGFQPKP